MESQPSRHAAFTAADILMQLDTYASQFEYPVLDNGNVYHIDCRLSVYGDKERWVLLFDIIGYNYRFGGHNGLYNCLYFYGNCLPFTPGTHNFNFMTMTDDREGMPAFGPDFRETLHPEATAILLNGEETPVLHDPAYYAARGVTLAKAPAISVWEFARAFVPEHRAGFLALEEEIRDRIPKDLPLLLRLDEWYHNDLSGEELPSAVETFRQIANVLETGDVSFYQPTKTPNTHWKNWPMGGTL